MAADVSRPRVFLDLTVGNDRAGRLIIELFADQAPKTCENFRQLCTAENPERLSYAGCPFHRIVEEFMIQGGDITKGDGTGGKSVYGNEFEDENLDWREVDKEGLVCMANRGPRDTNSSQFFITLIACPHLNGKNTVFGQLVGSKSLETLHRISNVEVDEDDDYRPRIEVVVAKCGELIRRGDPSQPVRKMQRAETARLNDTSGTRQSTDTSTSRGRHKRRLSSSPVRSPSPSREHGRKSGSRHRHNPRRSRRHGSSDESAESGSSTPKPRHRRRSDASPDHTLRGRPRERSRSPTDSPIQEQDDKKDLVGKLKDDDDGDPQHRHNRRRSPPPSRPRSRSPAFRRQRSLPNVYGEYAKAHGHGNREQRDGDRMDFDRERRRRGDDDRDDRRRKLDSIGRSFDRRRENGHGRLGHDDNSGRLGGGDDWDDGSSGITYKGRGIMKYREGGRRW